ncbi:MAG: hypothetical protein ACRC8A_09890 [Microcoleaceae cyanobacterium]
MKHLKLAGLFIVAALVALALYGQPQLTTKVAVADTTAQAAKPTITLQMINDAQQAWIDALVNIGRVYKEGGDYKKVANDVLSNLYDYDNGQVLFKPTLAFGANTFRLNREAAAAYFIGGNPNFPEDKGFALKPWVRGKYDNAGEGEDGVIIHNDIAITMGNVFLYDEQGNETVVDKTFVFKQGNDGKLRLIVHKSALPFSPLK